MEQWTRNIHEEGEAILAALGEEEMDYDSIDPSILLELSSSDPGLFYDSANGAAFLRAPYLPATVNGPMYPRTGPQSGAAKAWLEKAAQPAWSALPFGPRTPAATYVLPFDNMREVHDEFSWNYDYSAPSAPPQFAFAAPIFLEQSSQQHTSSQTEVEVESEAETETENEKPSSETPTQQVEMVQAIEVDDLETALLETSTLPDDFWSSRGQHPSFNSYSSPYYDLVNPTPHGSFADFRRMPRTVMQPIGQTGWFDHVRTGFVPTAQNAHPYAYHQGALPPFAHEIEPFKSMSNTSPSVIGIGENEPESLG